MSDTSTPVRIKKIKTYSYHTTIASIGIALIIGFGGGMFATSHAVGQTISIMNSSQPDNVDFVPVWKVWNIINDNFVPAAVASSTPIATTTAGLNQQKVWGMAAGLAASLNDPYTFFMPPQENKDFSSQLSGSFEGIGAQIDIKDSNLVVVSPLKGTPSEKAGIKAADIILKINGDSTVGMDTDTAVNKIRGPKGTIVTLTIMREGFAAPKDIPVTRDTINVPIVTTTKRDDGVFVIAVSSFTSNAPDLFRDALKDFAASGDTKLVLDMRGNPGGYLDAAVSMASWFLPQGDIVVTEDYAGHRDNIVHRSLGYNIFNSNLKMVILVDKGSASASEIFADALRYYKMGTLVGTNTFGKGVVQELFPVTEDTSVKVTVARWLGPDGIQIPHDGLIPDVVSTTSETLIKAKKDVQMEKAVQVLNAMK
ncbi:MAG: ctpA [Candidatus Kaiserbacteria bacterium]|nr:ctpA [Candidatus Kaiserbacteria bacterium]